MSLTAISVLINYVSRGWAALLAIAFVPIFIKLLGIEGYALIGLYISLSSLMFFVNLGLSATVLRELARYTGGALSTLEAKDLVFSAASLFAGILLIFLAVAYFTIPIVFSDWINNSALGKSKVTLSIELAFAALALRTMGGMYRNGLVGLDKHVIANMVDLVFITVRYVGAAMLIFLYRNDITLFFIVQVIAGLGETLSYRLALLVNLPVSKRSARWQVQLLIKNWRYSLGVTCFSSLTALLLQVDKLILTKLVTLEQFGYYSVAVTIATALSALSYPIVVTWQPKLARLYAEKKILQLHAMYRYGCRLLVLVTVPASLIICTFANDLLHLWQQSPDVVQKSSLVAALLILAQMMLALTYMAQALQVAYGWTRLLVISQALALLIMIPILVAMSFQWGIIGAASAVLLVLSAYSIIMTYIAHKSLLPEMALKWLAKYIMPTAVVILAIIAAVKFAFANDGFSFSHSIAQIIVVSILSLIGATMLSGELKSSMLTMLRAKR